MTHARRWQDLTWEEFGHLDPERTIAILPVAAIEQHGPHLPLEVDARINRGVLDLALTRVSPLTPLLVLPALPIGKSDEHAAFPGTLSLSTETLSRVWFEIGESVRRAGVRKLVIVNSHGGQPHVARIVAQDLRIRLDMLAVVANTFSFGEPPGLFPAEETRHGIHAGAAETSLMLHLAPDAVRSDRCADFSPASIAQDARAHELKFHSKVTIGWAIQDLHPTGACGNATLGTGQAGRAILEHIAARLATLLDEVADYPLSALRPMSPERPTDPPKTR